MTTFSHSERVYRSIFFIFDTDTIRAMAAAAVLVVVGAVVVVEE